MAFIKATKKECEEYNALINQAENWKGITNNWSAIQEIEGHYYITYNPKYPTELEIVDDRPEQELY